MDEDNNNPPPNRPYRVRRPSSSLISSTTSPIFPVPPNPNPLLRSSISRALGGGGSGSSNARNLQQQHQQQRDIDEEPQSPISSSSSSSLSSSFTAPSSRQRAAAAALSSNNANASTSAANYVAANPTARSSSPLGSPDSTQFWGPSQSPGPVNNNSNLYRSSVAGSSSHSSTSHSNNSGSGSNANHNNSNAGPPTPGGLCVVSSSTIEDDIPPSSPFSPSPSPAASLPEDNSSRGSNSVSVISGNSNNNHGNQDQAAGPESSPGPGPSRSIHSSPLLQGSLSRSSTLANAPEASSPSGIAAAEAGNGQYSNSNASFSAPSSSLSAYLSPLSKKIKKASSFERFSAQAQASINNTAANAGAAAGTNNVNLGTPSTSRQGQELNVSRTPNARKYNLLQQQQLSTSAALASSTSAISNPSRLIWDYVQGDASAVATAPAPNDASSNSNQGPSSGSSAATASTTTAVNIPPLQFSSKPYHIKKFAAKIALEQSKFAAAADESTASTSSQFPPLRASINLNATEETINAADNFLNDLHADSPLNLTDNSSTSAPQLVRAPAQMQKSFSKRVPMPPKQKILQRMQSGEIFDGISPPPPAIPLQPPSPPPMSQLQQQLQSQLMQQQDHVLHQQLLHDLQHQQQQQSSLGMEGQGMSSSSAQLDRYNSVSVSNYDALTRSGIAPTNGQDDFGNVQVQDVLSKSSMDCNADPSGIQLYEDPSDAYTYYYPGLGDEIFSSSAGGSGNGGTSSGGGRPLLVMPSGSGGGGGNLGAQDEMGNIFQGQTHGHLEFVLSNMNHGGAMADDNEIQQQHERMLAVNREIEDLQLGEVGIENGGGNVSSQHAFLDPNEVSSSLSKLPSDSTLRNLLMMQPLRSHDDSWIAASNEYQNSLRSLSSGSGLPTNSILGNALMMNSMGNNSGSGSSSMQGVGANWVNDWAARSLWQQQQHVQHDQQTDDDSGGDQDEVMDMSIMDVDKSHNFNPASSSSIIIKRNLHNQAMLDHNGAENLSLDDVDLVSERELVHGIPLDLQLQHLQQQQPLGLNMFGKNSMLESSMDPQQHPHHRSASVADNDEPVNLIASTNSVQELIQQHHHHHSSNGGHHLLNDGNTSCIVTAQDPSSSNCMTILTTTSSTTVSSPGSNFDALLNNSNLTAEEKRIIHYKKLKEAEALHLAQVRSGSVGNSSMSPSPPTANFIPDKPVQPKAFGSLPSPLSLVRDDNNQWHVFNRHKTIPANTRFGPVEGPMKKVYESDFHNMTEGASNYPYLVIVDESTILLQLDRSLDEMCNWMKFVRLARTSEEQNALISETNNLIYFTTCRDILPKTELCVGYCFEYAQKFGFQYLDPITTNPMDAYGHGNGSDQGEGNLEIEYEHEAPSILTVAKRQKGSANKHAVVQYSCFECDAEFGSPDELRAHLNNVHDDESEGIARRPKKKVLKKYYNSENIKPNGSPSSPVPSPSAGKNIDNFSNQAFSDVQPSPSVVPTNKNLLIKEVTGSKYEKFPRKKAAMENALVQDSGNAENACNSSSNSNSKPLVASSIITTTAASVPVVPKKKNKCSICYKSFASQDRLDRHFMAHCNEESKPLKCSTCSKRFLTNSALAGHVKTHSDGKGFECPLCEFSTSQLLQLKEHVQAHRNSTTGMFHCNRCTKKFSVYAMVRKHIRAFHGPRTFQCDYEQCTMKFPTSDKLKLHKLKHSDHREFLCAECGHQFKRRDKLVEHTKRMHIEGKKKPVAIPILPPPPPSKKPRLQKKFIPKLSDDELEKFTYRCNDCSVGFKRRGMLVNHLAKRHPEKTLQQVPELNLPILKPNRDYFCLYCERVYKSSSKRKSHILKSHPGKALPPQLRGKQIKSKSDEADKEANKAEDKALASGSVASSDENGVSASGIQLKRMSLYSDTGKVVATPHACEWCHRQYATRAKLLQHQRKNHLHLMPPDMQTPRAQKNNVRKNAVTPSPSASSSASLIPHGSGSKEFPQQIIQFQQTKSLSQDSSDPTLSHVSGSDEVIGFFLTTSISNGDLNSILQQAPELVVVPRTSLPSTLNTETLASITSTSGNNHNLTLTPVSAAAGGSSSRGGAPVYSIECTSKDSNSQSTNQ